MKEKNNEEENLNETNKEESFAKYIYELRLKRNLTQKMLADKIKVSDRTISKWENGLTVPDLHNIRVICKELGVSADSVVLEKSTFKDHFHNFLDLLKVLWKHLFNNIFKVIFFIIFILLLVYFINNYNAINIYTLTYESDNINFKNGIFIRNKSYNLLFIDDITLNDNNYDYEEVKVTLYVLVNGDKISLYENNGLDDIFIEELASYPTILNKDVLKSINKGLYLEIKLTDVNGKDKTYNCNISLTKEFQNNKLTYRNYQINTTYDNDYQIFLNNKNELASNTTEYKNFAADFNTYDTPKINSKIINKDSNNKLERLGYSYDANSDTYTKVDGDKEITHQPSMGVLYIKGNVKTLEYNLHYYFNNNRIDFNIYDKSKSVKVNFRYLVKEKLLNCYIGNCKNYQSEIDYILAEYRQISAIL